LCLRAVLSDLNADLIFPEFGLVFYWRFVVGLVILAIDDVGI
jgi:hypothetical protein